VIAIEAEFYPLVLLDLGRVGRTPEDFRRMFATFRVVNQRAIQERSRYVLIARTQEAPTAGERKIIVDEANRFSTDEYKLVSSLVLVIQNSIVRGVVTALGWMIPNIPPLEAARTTDAAVQSGVSHLRGLGVHYPAELAEKASQWFRRNEEQRWKVSS
jgi:hypothetical protein